MTAISMTIEHGGKTYPARIGTIIKTRLGADPDRGTFHSTIECRFDGGTQSFCPILGSETEGYTALVHSCIAAILKAVGVSYWEQLEHKNVLCVFAERATGSGGDMIQGVCGLDGNNFYLTRENPLC